MANSSGKTKRGQPRRTTELDKCPLYLHKSGHYAKRVRGRVRYFGKDLDAALALWQEQKEDLLAGRDPKPKGATGPTVADAVNTLLDLKQSLVNTGELSPRTWDGYHKAGQLLAKHFGRSRLLSDLRPDEFVSLRAKLAKGRSLVSLTNHLRCIRGILRHAYEVDMVATPFKVTTLLKMPSQKTLRAERQTRGAKEFSAEEIRWMLDGRTITDDDGNETAVPGAGVQLRAMILLGVNCGFGQSDCSKLTLSAIDLERGWQMFPRPKTATERRAQLWPETCEALQAVVAARKPPKGAELQDRVFVTKYGDEWVKARQKPDGGVVVIDSVCLLFSRLLTSLGIKRPGVGFYSLRRVFETVAGDTGDQVATDFIMGHLPAANDMSARYRQSINDDRLRRVTDHVRAWLFSSVE